MSEIGAITESQEFISQVLESKGGRTNMCTALEELEKDGIETEKFLPEKKNGIFDLKKRDQEVEKWVKELEIKTKNPDNPATTLPEETSRECTAKWLACNLDVLFSMSHCGSRHDQNIHSYGTAEAANQGLGVIIISDIFQRYSNFPDSCIRNGKIKSEYTHRRSVSRYH